MNSGPPRNEELDLPEARIIDEDKEFVGVMSTDEAMVIAEEAGLDLVLVSPDANPPVCRIMNYSKFKYENEKKMPAHAMASCTERGRATIVEVVCVGEMQFLGDARKFVGRQREEEAPVAGRSAESS